jgi:DNA-binding transcriptional regulator YiaG
MPNIATALKAEISRVARKELRAETDSLRKATTSYRREIAALKKRVAALEKQAKRGGRATRVQAETGGEAEGRQLRFSATRFAAQRKKLGLSAVDFARLLGVSALTVYKWEGGKSRPRRAQLEAIAAARSLGKRAALARLEELQKA